MDKMEPIQQNLLEKSMNPYPSIAQVGSLKYKTEDI